MKKTNPIIAVFILVAMAFTMTVSAVVFTPSAEVDAKLTVAQLADEEGTPADAVIVNDEGTVVAGIPTVEITLLNEALDADPAEATATEEKLTEAYEELKDGALTELVPDFKKAWDEVMEGAPIEHAVVCNAFDVSVNEEMQELIASLDGEVKFVITGLNIANGTKVIVLHKKADGTWEVVRSEWAEEGLAVYTKSFSPFVILEDNGSLPDEGGDSPETGVNGIGSAVCAALCAAVAAAFVVKAKKEF